MARAKRPQGKTASVKIPIESSKYFPVPDFNEIEQNTCIHSNLKAEKYLM